ncbi:MAG: Do family serine endopeptidase [Bacteroidota bacterium]
MKNLSSLFLSAVLGSAITIGSFQLFYGGNGNDQTATPVEKTPIVQTAYTSNDESSRSSSAVPFDFTAASEKVTPAVVHITSKQTSGRSTSDEQIPDQFREFFGPFFRDRGSDAPRVGSGSGVIINDKGYIVTNNHVIDNADEVTVILSDNSSYAAEVIGTDPNSDLAVIKVEAQGLPYLSLENSDNVKIGEWVLAVGFPFNLNTTVTAGIVSAKGRSINIIQDDDGDRATNTSIESFIQTDAAINPGNSGGALVNTNGNLIGINTAIASPTGSYSGYGFAVPSNIVNKVVSDLIEYGVVQRGWLGVTIQNVNAQVAEEKDLSVKTGAYISDISDASGAKDAGIRTEDVIVNIDGQRINRTSELIGYIGSKRPGDRVNVTVNRDGREMDFEVLLKNRQGNLEVVKNRTETVYAGLGVTLEDIDERKLERLGLDYGVKVQKVGKGKVQQYTDMKDGFIITKIDGQRVYSKDDVAKILKNKQGGVLIEGLYENESRKYYYGLEM